MNISRLRAAMTAGLEALQTAKEAFDIFQEELALSQQEELSLAEPPPVESLPMGIVSDRCIDCGKPSLTDSFYCATCRLDPGPR